MPESARIIHSFVERLDLVNRLNDAGADFDKAMLAGDVEKAHSHIKEMEQILRSMGFKDEDLVIFKET